MNDAFGLIEDNKEIILFAFSILLGLKSGFTFISSTPIERQFFSKEKRLLYEFINLISLFIIAPTVFFFVLFTEFNIVKNFFYNWFGIFAISLLILCLIILLKKGFFPTKRKKWFKKIRKKLILSRLKNKFEAILITLIVIISWVVFGTLNVDILKGSLDLNVKTVSILLFMFFELYMIYVTLVWGTDFKFTKPIPVNIITEGTKYERYYIYNPSDKNFILIGKEISAHLCKNPVLLNVDKINSCIQVNTIIHIE